MSYSELSVEDRATIQLGQAQGLSLRAIAHLISRSLSTISRELRRNRDAGGGYSTRSAQQRMRDRRQVCRPQRKLLQGSGCLELVTHMLRERLSPEQIAGKHAQHEHTQPQRCLRLPLDALKRDLCLAGQ